MQNKTPVNGAWLYRLGGYPAIMAKTIERLKAFLLDRLLRALVFIALAFLVAVFLGLAAIRALFGPR